MAQINYDNDINMVMLRMMGQMSADYIRVSPSEATVSWTAPHWEANPLDLSVATAPLNNAMTMYFGAVVVLSDKELNPSNYPSNGQAYVASNDLNNPAAMLNNAYVVGATYGDMITTSITIHNLDPAKVYFCSVHAVSETLNYANPGVLTYPATLFTDTYSGDIPRSDTAPIAPVLGECYYNPANNTVFMWTGTAWITASTYDTIVGKEFPVTAPDQGQFFYNINNKALYVYDGATWQVANTENKGLTTTDKYQIGTDFSTDEFQKTINTLKMQFGWPQTCLELTNEHFMIAINNALNATRQLCDNAYTHDYYYVKMKPDQYVYYLNDPVAGTNKVVDVIKCHRLNFTGGGLGASGSTDSFYAQAFMNMYVANGSFSTVDYYLVSAFGEHLSKLFANELAFNWRENTRELTIYKSIKNEEHCCIEVASERTDQQLLMDRYLFPWIQDWANYEITMMLGQVRSKFQTYPGPNGGVSLNGSELNQMADAMRIELMRQVQDYEIGNGTTWGNASFIFG